MGEILNIPVQMIASCTTSGDFTPIRFRYETASCELITVRILSVESRKTMTKNELIYDCRGDYFGTEKIFSLRYHIPEHRWMLRGIR